MMEVYNRFVRPCSDRGTGDSLWGAEAVQAEQVPVFSEHNVFLELVFPNCTESAEIDRGPDRIDLYAVFGLLGSMGVPPRVNCPRLFVEPVGDRTREEYGDDQADKHFDSEENEAEEERRIFPGRKSPNQGDVRHVLVL